MGKITLKESQLKQIITETVKKVLRENSRDDFYKSQIQKEFPDALNNYDGKIGYDEYYLQLTNSNKQKISRKLNINNPNSFNKSDIDEYLNSVPAIPKGIDGDLLDEWLEDLQIGTSKITDENSFKLFMDYVNNDDKDSNYFYRKLLNRKQY